MVYSSWFLSNILLFIYNSVYLFILPSMDIVIFRTFFFFSGRNCFSKDPQMCCLAPWVSDPRKHTFQGGKAGSCCWIAFQCDVPHFTVKASIRDSPQKPTANIWHFRFECFCYSGGFLKCSFSWGFVRTIGLFYFFKDFFFLMWTIFKVIIEFVTILFLFYVLVFWLPGMWDLSSPVRNWTLYPLHWNLKS